MVEKFYWKNVRRVKNEVDIYASMWKKFAIAVMWKSMVKKIVCNIMNVYIFHLYTDIYTWMHIYIYTHTHPCSGTIIKEVHKKLLTVVAFEKEKGMAGEEHGGREIYCI